MRYNDNQRRVLSSFEDTRQAVTQVAALAQRCIAIYTPDLEPGIYDDPEFLEVLKRLVLSKRYARVRVLIQNPGKTNRNGNALVSLARRLNTYIEFRNVDQKYREKHDEAYLIADDKAILFRASSGKWEGIVGDHEPAIAQRQLEIFEEIWDASEFKLERYEARVS